MLSFLLANKTVAGNKIIDYSNSNCNTSYQKAGVPLKRGLMVPWGLLKCGMLYIKIVEKLIEKHLIISLVCLGPPRPLEKIVGMLYIRIDLTQITVLRLLSKLHKTAETALVAPLRPPAHGW